MDASRSTEAPPRFLKRFVLSVVRPAVAAAPATLLTATLATACGGRSDLNVGLGDAGTECSVSPICSDNTRGTWRLTTSSGGAVGYLFAFDGTGACNSTSDNFLLSLMATTGECDRNGAYNVLENTAAALHFSADNLGGSFSPQCGGDPGTESMQLLLDRTSCDGVTYELAVHDSAPASPYDVTLVATRCRCDVGWEPCVQPLPAEPCAP
jgi:hypothetical protein